MRPPFLPTVSVVVNTYNRAAQVGKALESVLSQSGVDFELVVVDDGSTDETQAVLAGIDDPRMRCVRQSNRGLSASRNVGAREACGEWLIFLDDDDRFCPGGLETLLRATTDPSCRVVIGGVRFVDGTGQVLRERAPASLGDALAGTFLISRTLFHAAGGYLEGIPCSHQTEFFVRVSQGLGDGNGGKAISYVADPVVEIERRPATGRPEQSPAHTYFGARWLLARHPDWYGKGRARADLEGLTGVNAMRIGREAEARRRFASAIRHDPLSPLRYLRFTAAVVPPIGRRIWLRQWDSAPGTPRLLHRVQRPDHPGGTISHPALERDPSPGSDSLFIPWRYRENPPAPLDGANPVFWPHGLHSDGRRPKPIHKLAARLVRFDGLAPVVEISYGSGDGPVRCFPEGRRIAGDLDDEAAWNAIASLEPQLLVCSNVVERVSDPRRLLSGIRRAVGQGGVALLSTLDRSRLGPEAALGPPTDPLHVREWSADEFALLLESCGFEVMEVERRVWRALHLGANSARRPSMHFVVRAARENPLTITQRGVPQTASPRAVATLGTGR